MAEKIYSSIIDELLEDRKPDWDMVGLKDAVKSGEEQQDRTQQYVDESFLDDLAGESKHTELPSDSKSATLLNRMAEKEAALPRLGGVQTGRTRFATHAEDYENELGSDESLFDEMTMDFTKAHSEATSKDEHGREGVANRNRSDAEILAYVKKLLNQGTPPARVAALVQKVAEIELLDKKDNMGMSYLNNNAGVLGLAYMEPGSSEGFLPNAQMDMESPAYEKSNQVIASEKKNFCRHCNKEVKPKFRDAVALCPECSKPVFTIPKQGSRPVTSADCVRQFNAWKAAGIKPRAASVKRVAGCSDCAFFKAKTCNLYHLPVVANAKELAAVVNRLTAGVPSGSKKAALVALANRDGMRVEPKHFANRPVQKTSAKTVESLRVEREEQQKKVAAAPFTVATIEKMHKEGKTLDAIYQLGISKIGSVHAGWAIKEFVASLKAKGLKIALSQIDCKLLKQKLAVNNAIIGAIKCADCVYRSDMHCGLTGGTLVSFPGMEKTGKVASAKAPTDAKKLMEEYDLTSRSEVGDIEYNTPERLDVEMGNVPTAGDI